jgi:hypothetical protein
VNGCTYQCTDGALLQSTASVHNCSCGRFDKTVFWRTPDSKIPMQAFRHPVPRTGLQQLGPWQAQNPPIPHEGSLIASSSAVPNMANPSGGRPLSWVPRQSQTWPIPQGGSLTAGSLWQDPDGPPERLRPYVRPKACPDSGFRRRSPRRNPF